MALIQWLENGLQGVAVQIKTTGCTLNVFQLKIDANTYIKETGHQY